MSDIVQARISDLSSALDDDSLPAVHWQYPANDGVSPCSGWRRDVKHGFDRLAALTILLILAIPLLIVALAVKLDSPGPVIFRQRRNGLNGREFTILKFRSMTTTACKATKVEQAKDNDPRVTRVGRILRHTSIDELPQLWNVVRGDMSLVGPRPHAVEHNVYYGAVIPRYHERHRLRPGITGLAQTTGLRGETSAIEAMKSRIDCDLEYIANWSLALDMRILLKTPMACIRLAYRSIKAKV